MGDKREFILWQLGGLGLGVIFLTLYVVLPREHEARLVGGFLIILGAILLWGNERVISVIATANRLMWGYVYRERDIAGGRIVIVLGALFFIGIGSALLLGLAHLGPGIAPN